MGLFSYNLNKHLKIIQMEKKKIMQKSLNLPTHLSNSSRIQVIKMFYLAADVGFTFQCSDKLSFIVLGSV